MAFVLVSLASWFGLLGLFGPYLPANANSTNRQITFNMHGNQLTGHWSKKNGRWHFLKISKISKLSGANLRRTASVKTSQTANNVHDIRKVRISKVPATTASITPSAQRRSKKKALRAALADEIGRWAKIGNRWEWQATGKTAKIKKQPAQSQGTRKAAASEKDRLKQADVPVGSQSEPHWVRGDGRWSFEVVEEHTIIRHI